MIEAPEIIHTSERLTAMIHLVIAKNEIQTAMGPSISEVFASLAA